MLSPSIDTIRLFVHILAASVWVGGQIVLAGIVPGLRRSAPEAVQGVANAFARVAWPAFAVVVLTGFWNFGAVSVGSASTAYQITLFVKIFLAIGSGAAAAVHQVGNTTAAKAIGGSLGLLFALGAMFTGYLLTTGT